MFVVNEDNSIYVTRGDEAFISVTASNGEETHKFKAGDVLRIKVFAKKDCSDVVMQKDFPITKETESVELYLDKNDTKIGEVISKPRDLWYEIELNPLTNPQTIIGYDDEGARIFKLFPEGRDLTEDEPIITPEDIPIVDKELDLTSQRPVENQAIARAVTNLRNSIEKTNDKVKSNADSLSANILSTNSAVAVERARVDKLVSGGVVDDAELLDVRVGVGGVQYESAGTAVRTQAQLIINSEEAFRNDGLCYLKGGFEYGQIDNTGAEFVSAHRIRSSEAVFYDRDIVVTPKSGFRYSVHTYTLDGNYVSETGWLTTEHTISKNTPFRVVIARVDEDATETAELTDFVKGITVTTVLSELINKVKIDRNALDIHKADNCHLSSMIRSNNLSDPKQIEEGGYYAFKTGKWVERSDISSTGLIPCNKGEVYYCGINFTDIRGGNCTFWNNYGEYVCGLDVFDGSQGFEVPDNDEIKYMRVSFYSTEKSVWHINLGNYYEYDEYKAVYVLDKEVETPAFDSSNPLPKTEEETQQLYYTNTYKDDVTVMHKRNNAVGTSYQFTVVNKEKFDGTKTKVAISGTSSTNKLGDANNTNVGAFAKANGFLHIVNGGIYLTKTGKADGITIINGEILKSTGVEQFAVEQYVLGITEDGEMKAYINKTAEDILSDGAIYALTGFVPLIQNGVTVDDSILAVCPHYNSRHPRQIVGVLKDGNYFTFCCDGRTDGENGMTLKECIDTMLNDFKVKFAFNLDGGGSTQTTVGKKQINRVIDGRTIPNVITFR